MYFIANVSIGDGSPENPFFASFTSNRILRHFVDAVTQNPNIAVQLHVDQTFKTNTCAYPVTVIGFSDLSGCFHLLSMSIVSNQTGAYILHAFNDLKDELIEQFNFELKPDYVMADAGRAEHLAILQAFPNASQLMCWFHVCKNVRDRLR
jgi:hypothetical protein